VFLIVFFIWSLSEYLLHRFVFHYRPHTPFQEKVVFLFHGIQHATLAGQNPPGYAPVVSIPMALLFFGLFSLILNKRIGNLALGLSYVFRIQWLAILIYDLTHYATTIFRCAMDFLKIHQAPSHQHHYKTPNKVSGLAPVLGYRFRTYPNKSDEKNS